MYIPYPQDAVPLAEEFWKLIPRPWYTDPDQEINPYFMFTNALTAEGFYPTSLIRLWRLRPGSLIYFQCLETLRAQFIIKILKNGEIKIWQAWRTMPHGLKGDMSFVSSWLLNPRTGSGFMYSRTIAGFDTAERNPRILVPGFPSFEQQRIERKNRLSEYTVKSILVKPLRIIRRAA
ncbi:MAG TPA: hypothetical protein VJJ72_01625 [Candidatus Paceibacterota bacterium]